MSKTYLKSDHFNGGGSEQLQGAQKTACDKKPIWQLANIQGHCVPQWNAAQFNFTLLAGDILKWRGIIMKPSIIAFMLLASTTLALLAQELSVEDRACITGAVGKLPQLAALKIEESRAIEGRVLEQPQSQGLRKWNVYRVKVEIDVSVAGHRSTYVFNCIHSGQATVIQPLGIR
jgi:hypothetical protein